MKLSVTYRWRLVFLYLFPTTNWWVNRSFSTEKSVIFSEGSSWNQFSARPFNFVGNKWHQVFYQHIWMLIWALYVGMWLSGSVRPKNGSMVGVLIFLGLSASMIAWLNRTMNLRAKLLIRGSLDWAESPCPSLWAAFLLRTSYPLMRRFSLRKCWVSLGFCPTSPLGDLETWVSSPCWADLPLGRWHSFSPCQHLCRSCWLCSLAADRCRLGWPWT